MKPLRRVLRWVLWISLAAFLLLQLKQVEHTNPPVRSEVEAPAEIKAILRRSCYDCHSHETRWPWYSWVAPASWFIAEDVEEGRDEMNFSDWPRLDPEEQEEIREEIREQVVDGEMPLPKYLLLHPRARLSGADQEALLRWTKRAAGGSR
jgi:hypothetical protein